MGHGHIDQRHARIINLFYANTFNPHLNLHRPCFFGLEKPGLEGKVIKTYPQSHIMTPWDRLQRIAQVQTGHRRRDDGRRDASPRLKGIEPPIRLQPGGAWRS